MKKRISILFCLLIALCSNAQTAGYKYAAPINTPAQSGFYNIALTPQMNAHLKTDLSDLRIVNDSGKWVPHILHNPAREIVSETANYDMDYSILTNNQTVTVVLIKKHDEEISNLSLRITNTGSERFSTLSGSNDAKSWFVINDSILLRPFSEDKGTVARMGIMFPAVNFKFLKLSLLNSNKDPLGIIGITSAHVFNMKPYFVPEPVLNPATTIQQKDSGNISYIKVIQPDTYQFSRFSIAFEGAKYFSRDITLCIPSANNICGTPVQAFTVSNNSTLNFGLSPQKVKTFYLLIHNADNLPLKVSSVQTSSEYIFLSSYLDKGQSYRLLMDNATATMPDYDLAKLNLPRVIDSTSYLQTGDIVFIEKKQPQVVKQKENGKIILWSAIIGILLLLLFFTMKMLKEINKNKSDVHL